MRHSFEPKNIAIIGVSEEKGKVGNSLAKKFKDKNNVYFINKKRDKVLGKKCYSSLSEIKEKLDLIIIAVPPKYVNDIIKGGFSKNYIVITAGVKIEKFKDVNIIGPNCFGLVNTKSSLDCTFAKEFPLKGRISFISQSGALWSAVASYSRKYNIGFNKFVSLGDMCDVNFNDMLEYFIQDKENDVILLYIEGLKDGRKLMNLISTSKKPIVVLKGGKSESGAKATLSHTGSLAGSYAVYQSAIKQANGYFANGLIEAIDSAKFLSLQGKLNEKRTVVLTNAGGPGVLVSDLLDEIGYNLVKLPNLNFNLPENWSKNNPIDIIGDADYLRYEEVINKLKGNFFDLLIVLLTPQDMIDELGVAKSVINFRNKTKKNVICCFMSENIDNVKKNLEDNGILCFSTIERMINMLKVLLP